MKRTSCLLTVLVLVTMVLGINTVHASSGSTPIQYVSSLSDSERVVVDGLASMAGVEINENDIIIIKNDYVSIRHSLNDSDDQVTYIVGATIRNGELSLLNPEQLAEELDLRSNVSYDANFKVNSQVALTLTYTAYYNKYYNSHNYWYYYRPYMLRAKWSPGAVSGLTVSNMRIGYGSNGNLVSYPACLDDSDMSSYIVQSNYGHYIEINKANPFKQNIWHLVILMHFGLQTISIMDRI